MMTPANKSTENKITAAHNAPKQQSDNAAAQFVDNRPAAIAQRKMQAAINESPRVKQLPAQPEWINNSPHMHQVRAQQVTDKRASVKPLGAATAGAETVQLRQDLHPETTEAKPALLQKKKNNTGLPDQLKAGVENLSGLSMDDVKVHYNSAKPAELQAHAYAQGTDIHLAPRQEEYLPHEAWHVVQQKQGRVRPTLQLKGTVNVNDDAALEQEADVMGARAMQLQANPALTPPRTEGNKSGVVQRRLLSNKEISSWMSWALKNTLPNRQAIMLEIYNQMRFKLDPTPAPFTTIQAAITALTTATALRPAQIDQEDAAVIDKEATIRQQVKGDPAKLFELKMKEQIEEKSPAFEAKYAHHIFQGDFSGGVPTGYHSKIDGSATHQAYGATTPVPNGVAGVYQQSVQSIVNPANRKAMRSTFFPNNATHDMIIRAITSVYGAGLSRVGYVDPVVDGMELTKKGNTIFPAGGADTPALPYP